MLRDPLVPVADPEAPDLPVPVGDPDVPVPVVSVFVSVFVFVPDLRFRRVRRFFAPALPVVSSVPDMVDPAVPEAAPLADVFPAVELPLRVRVEPAVDPGRPVRASVLVPDPLAELELVPRVLSDVPELPLVCANIIGSATTVTSVDVSIRLIDPPCGWNPVHETQSQHGNIVLTVSFEDPRTY